MKRGKIYRPDTTTLDPFPLQVIDHHAESDISVYTPREHVPFFVIGVSSSDEAEIVRDHPLHLFGAGLILSLYTTLTGWKRNLQRCSQA